MFLFFTLVNLFLLLIVGLSLLGGEKITFPFPLKSNLLEMERKERLQAGFLPLIGLLMSIYPVQTMYIVDTYFGGFLVLIKDTFGDLGFLIFLLSVIGCVMVRLEAIRSEK